MVATESKQMTRSILERLAQDLRYAARRLGRDRGFTIAATLILAVGIGACTAMFSIVHAVLLRPFAVRSPEQLVMLWAVDTRHQAVGELAYSARRDMLGAMRSFEDLALVGSVNWGGTLRMPGVAPVALSSSAVSGTFFDVLGASALLGRTLSAKDDEPSAAPVMVLSHATWTQYFGGDPTVIGRKVPMNGEGTPALVEVVGVMPTDFFFPRGAQVLDAGRRGALRDRRRLRRPAPETTGGCRRLLRRGPVEAGRGPCGRA